MKFKNDIDKLQYDLLDLNETVIRKKLNLLQKQRDVNIRAKDRDKQRTMKALWRRKKYQILKGIKKWHKSTQGKRFHRALARFNTLRENNISEGMVDITFDEINEALLGLSSIETHLYLELNYYEPDLEALEQFIEIVKNYINESDILKQELLNSYFTGKIDSNILEEIIEIFDFFVDPKMYLYAKRELKGLSNDIDAIEDEEQKEAFRRQLEALKNIDYSKSLSEQIVV
jgi:hypothetical protein